ncbi:MAG: hypothetical protein KDA30_16200, partial [Phycisphaerales bacterium]|nr:hypothetical protein [Phycisphaerales bacterium]
WEFAIQNLNSHSSAGTVTIDVPAGATVSNVGFHDVDYHSGEPYSGVDWTTTLGAGSVAWSTTPYATDPNANALRWGTLYNFRFETDMPQAIPQNVSLGLFRPGATTPAIATFNPPHQVAAVVGIDQCANTGETFSNPVQFQVTSQMGAPIPGVTVAFDSGASNATV